MSGRRIENVSENTLLLLGQIFKDLYFLPNVYSQEEYSPEDPANPCTNYPTKEYSSYADCDDEFVRRSLPPGLKPFWAVDDISEADDTISIDNDVWEHMDFGKVFCEVISNNNFVLKTASIMVFLSPTVCRLV